MRARTHGDVVQRVQWSPDGGTLASVGGHGPGSVWVWPVGSPPRALEGARGTPMSCAFDRGCAQLLVHTREGQALLFGVGGADAPRVVSIADEDPDARIESVAWAPDGTFVALGSDGAVHRFDADGARAKPPLFADEADPIVVRAAGERVLALFRRAGAVVFDARGERVRCAPAGGGLHHDAALSRDGAFAAIAVGEVVEVWDLASGASGARTARLVHGGTVRSVQFSHDGRSVLSASADGTGRLSPLDGSAPRILKHDRPLNGAAIRRDGAVVLLHDERSSATLHLVDRPAAPLRIGDLDESVSAFDLDPTGRLVGLGFERGGVEVVTLEAPFRAELPPITPPVEGAAPTSPFEVPIRFVPTGDADTPLAGHALGRWWLLQVNDFPATRSVYTLLGDGGEQLEFDAWPELWWRPE